MAGLTHQPGIRGLSAGLALSGAAIALTSVSLLQPEAEIPLLIITFLMAGSCLAISILHGLLLWKLRRALVPPTGGGRNVPLASGLPSACHAGGAGDTTEMTGLVEGIIHDLRGHVNTILGFAELLDGAERRNVPEGDRHAYLRTLLESSEKLSASLADLSDLARIERGSLKLLDHDVDAAELVEAAVRQCHEAAESANVDILVCVQDGIELHCDAARVNRAVMMLTLRAIHASPAGAAIRLCFERTRDGGLAFSISEYGSAKSAIEMPGRLKKFSPGHFPSHGMGATALPVARRIAMLHGGTLTVENLEGGGTVTRFTLPASRVAWLPVTGDQAFEAA